MEVAAYKLVIMTLVLAGMWGLILYSISDHKKQLRKQEHRRRMRGKIRVLPGGKNIP